MVISDNVVVSIVSGVSSLLVVWWCWIFWVMVCVLVSSGVSVINFCGVSVVVSVVMMMVIVVGVSCLSVIDCFINIYVISIFSVISDLGCRLLLNGS